MAKSEKKRGFDNDYYHNMIKLSINHYKPDHFTYEQLEEAARVLGLTVSLDEIEKTRFDNMKVVEPE